MVTLFLYLSCILFMSSSTATTLSSLLANIYKLSTPARPTSQHIRDTDAFFDFLETFAKRRPADFIKKWDFVTQNISAGILYVAAPGKLDRDGLKPYIMRVDNKIEAGVESLYIFARRDDNVVAVEELIKRIQDKYKKRVTIHVEKYKSFFRGERLQSICATVKIKNI